MQSFTLVLVYLSKQLTKVWYRFIIIKIKIYFQLIQFLQINELTVKNEMELNNLLNLILKNNKSIYKKKLKVQKYCKDYFTKLHSENLFKKLKRIEKKSNYCSNSNFRYKKI